MARFHCFYVGKRKVNRDGHVELAKAYYSAPFEYLGREVWARWDARLAHLFGHRLEQIADRLQDSATHQLNHAEFLELVLQDERLVRSPHEDGPTSAKSNRSATSTGRSTRRFSRSKSLICRCAPEARDVLLIGSLDIGKSFRARAIGCLGIKQVLVVLYRSTFDVVRNFLHDQVLVDQVKLVVRYLNPDLLIIDDMGMKHLPRKGARCCSRSSCAATRCTPP